MNEKEKQKKISIIIPVYNTEKLLKKCILSAINQTYKNLEIICIDDGATDDSGKILDELALTDTRIKVIHQKNIGESGARNVGLRNITGDYFGFMDCDDWIEPNMYEELAYALESTDSDMAISSWFYEDGRECKEITNKKSISEKVFGRNQLMRYVYERDSYRAFAYMWNKLYRRELLLDGEGNEIRFDEKLQLGGDVLFLAQLVLHTKKAVYLEKAFYHYLQRKNSGCHSVDLMKRRDWLKAYEMIIEQFQKEEIDDNILGYVKRFLAYQSSNVAKIAYEQKNKDMLNESQKIMSQYSREYMKLNSMYKERVNEFINILHYSIT